MGKTIRKHAVGRPPEPRLGALHGGIIQRLVTLKNTRGITFALWPRVVDVNHQTFRNAIEGRAPATFTVLSMLARVAAIVNVPAEHVTSHELPQIPVAMIIDDVMRLREIGKTPFIDAFCDQRIKELEATGGGEQQ